MVRTLKEVDEMAIEITKEVYFKDQDSIPKSLGYAAMGFRDGISLGYRKCLEDLKNSLEDLKNNG